MSEQIPAELTPYVIQVKPNWLARISLASVLLLLLFFSITQYQAARENQRQFTIASSDRAQADKDRRLAILALEQARKAEEDSSAARAAALTQNGQLIEIALTLEDQLVRLGVNPSVPKNSVLRLRALSTAGSAVPPPFSVSPGASQPTPPQPTTTPAHPTGSPTSTTPPPAPRPTVPVPTPTFTPPSLGITACVLVCVGL